MAPRPHRLFDGSPDKFGERAGHLSPAIYSPSIGIPGRQAIHFPQALDLRSSLPLPVRTRGAGVPGRKPCGADLDQLLSPVTTWCVRRLARPQQTDDDRAGDPAKGQ